MANNTASSMELDRKGQLTKHQQGLERLLQSTCHTPEANLFISLA
jgi:hypothetical protein